MNIKLLHSILEDVVGQIDSESTVTIDHNELVISSSLKIWDNMNNTDIEFMCSRGFRWDGNSSTWRRSL